MRPLAKKIMDVYGRVILENMEKGLLERRKGRICLTEQGLDVANRVMADFCFERKEEMGMENINEVPEIQAFADYIRNPLFERLCTDMEEHYHIKPRVEFSRCSWEYGWNIKFKKSGKSLCTLYPRENYFTVLVVVGEKKGKGLKRFYRDCLWKSRKFIGRQKKATDSDG